MSDEVPPAPSSPPEDWRARLPTEIRGEASLAAIPDVAALAKSYVHAQRLIGREKVPLPAKDADDGEWALLFDRLGRPKSPGEYALTPPEGLTASAEIVPAVAEDYRRTAHELGLLPRQVQGLYSWFMQLNDRQTADPHSASRHAIEEGKRTLRQEWAGDYDRRVDLARRTVRRFGGEELEAHLVESGLGDDPRLLRFLAAAGVALAEDRPDVRRGAGSAPRDGFASSPADAMSEISRLKFDPEFQKAYVGASHPGHKDAVARMEQLFAYAYPA
jgi:hypothetical protein